jgi:hypothetical protein
VKSIRAFLCFSLEKLNVVNALNFREEVSTSAALSTFNTWVKIGKETKIEKNKKY